MSGALMVDTRFRVMGSDAHVAVATSGSRLDGDALLEAAHARLVRLESIWSRFLPDSELSLANSRPGEWVELSPETVELVDRALRARTATGGLFDPTLLGEVAAAGYVASLDGSGRRGPVPVAPRDDASTAPVELDRSGLRLRVRRGVGFDPGGIAKGFAADLIADELLHLGADGACVNVGGDLRVAGRVPGDWTIDVEDPRVPDGPPIRRLSIAEGAVATSSRLRRRWTRPDGTESHHLIDPRTGRPARSAVLTATVVAAEGWVAEAAATAAFLAHDPADPSAVADVLADAGATGLLVTTSGVVELPGVDEFLW